MNQTQTILPVYTCDVSGVCSALYELGGLVVMHDPSGCNSTYNTHDEIRWYEKESLIFVSGLTQRDAVMGNDEKLFRDVMDAAKEFQPAFIAITNSPIPWLIGCDFSSLVKRLERESKIPAFYVPANGMHDYTQGAGKAFEMVAERLVDEKYRAKIKNSVNIIGMTPLDYGAKGCAQSIRKTLEDAGFKVNSVWAMDDLPENLKHAGEAAVNLVVSSTGLPAAKKLSFKFGTPYVAGTPAGKFTQELLLSLERARKTKENICAYKNIPSDASISLRPDTAVLIGESVVSGSLAAAIRLQCGIETKVICPLETCKGLLRHCDIHVQGEEETRLQLEGAKTVIADPMYRPLCPEDAAFYSLPTVALSGRIYLKNMKDLSQCDITDILRNHSSGLLHMHPDKFAF